MTSYARLSGEDVVEIVDLPDEVTPQDAFTAEIAATLLPCPAEVSEGWTLVDETWAPPTLATPDPPDLYAHAADRRWQVETGGITVGGVPVATDRESQGLITGAHAYVLANPDVTIKFKAASGFVDLDAATVTVVATAVAAHVQASFSAEAEVVAAITDGAIATTQQIDDWPWPG